jgi:hemoglobin/transferrin/lactoferrin receptor protein
MGSSIRPGASALVLAGLLAAPALAEEPSGPVEPKVVVTATRTPVVETEAPATVTLKTDEEIADELATDIKDLVRFEPGVSVRRQPARFTAALGATGRAGNESFVIRGIGGNRVLIQVDGVRIPYGFSFGAQDVGRGDYVDVGLVKSVEFLRGPASALYGGDGLSGAVSFTTADPADFLAGDAAFGGLLRGAYSSADEEYAGTAVAAGRAGPVSGLIAYTRRDFAELDNQGDNDVVGAARTTPNPQDGRSDALLAKLAWEIGGGHQLRLTGEHLDTRLATEGLTGRSATVDLLEGLDEGSRSRIAADWVWEGQGPLEFARAGAYVQEAEDSQLTGEDRTPLPDRERFNTFDNRVAGVSAEARLRFATGPLGHRLAFGGDWSETRQTGIRDGVVAPVGETFPTRAFPPTEFSLAGVFLGDEIEVGPLTFFPAIRYDRYELTPEPDPLLPRFAAAGQSGDRVSPKLGVVWRTHERVRLFANYAEGFRAPEPSQVNQFFENLAFGYTSIPNPELGPERSESVEAGLRYVGEGVTASVAVFAADYREFISQEVVGGAFTPANPAVFQFVNLDRAEVEGLEARAQAEFGAGFSGDFAFSYADGDVIKPNGDRGPLSTVDPVKIVAGLGWREAAARYGGRLIVTHSARKANRDAEGLCSGACFRPDAFTIVDVTGFWRITDAATLRAGVFNLTDETYAWWSDVRGLAASSTIADAFTQPGRNASVSLSWRY